MQDITLIRHLPSPLDFVTLRRDTVWGDITLDQAKAALDHSICGVSVYDDTSVIGMARVIGDGVLNLYIQDMIVAKGYRQQGFGDKIMKTLILYLQDHYPHDCTVGLMAAKGKARFYQTYGFHIRPTDITDAGMTASLGELKSHLVKTALNP